jgi:hypothetical protein
MLVKLLIVLASLDFGDSGMGEPDQWVQDHIIDPMQPHVVAFVSALAGVLVLKILTRT